MRRSLIKSFISVIFIIFTSTTYAWDCHYLLTYAALENTHRIGQKPTVSAETLDSFLKKERTGLVQVLNKNEKWSEENIPYYPALPKNLEFTGTKKLPLKLQFLEAIRVNPDMRFPLFLQYPPKAKHTIHQDPLALSDVMLPMLANSGLMAMSSLPLEGLKPNEKISPLEIIASASDEPDYGMDINLWENSGTWYGKLYHWGPEPFGILSKPMTSQAPFHIGYYYESPLLYKIEPSLHDCYPEYRIHLFLELSRFAFKTGHPYWGYRFLGWGLHYLQDLTQPYHTTLAPNISSSKLIFATAVNYIGIHSPKNNIIQEVTKEHYDFETKEFLLLKNEMGANNPNAPILQALQDTSGDAKYPAYSNEFPRDIAAKESHADANEVNSDPANLFPAVGADTRNFVRYATS